MLQTRASDYHNVLLQVLQASRLRSAAGEVKVKVEVEVKVEVKVSIQDIFGHWKF
jgi:hypothetical protein